MKSQISTSLAVLALSVVLSACGGGAATAPSSSAPATTPSTSSPSATQTGQAAAVELKTASSSAGQIVVDGKGMSVYIFTKDTKDSGKSACTGGCAATWPAVTTTSDSPKVDGVTGKVGTITTADGKKQLTLNGLPVYHYAQDKAPGDIKGQGVNNVWYVVNPAGDMITSAAVGSSY